MRIVAGKFRSRRLLGPKKGKFRPTSDRVREALFNIIGPMDSSTWFADLYAGSGAMGIEALSRGAGHVTWVESLGANCWTIRQNLKALSVDAGGGGAGGGIVQQKATEFAARTTGRFDVVFADPPYELPVEEVLAGLSGPELLRPGGTLVLEHASRQSSPEASGRLEKVDQRRYGDTTLSIYKERAP